MLWTLAKAFPGRLESKYRTLVHQNVNDDLMQGAHELMLSVKNNKRR